MRVECDINTIVNGNILVETNSLETNNINSSFLGNILVDNRDILKTGGDASITVTKINAKTYVNKKGNNIKVLSCFEWN